MHGCLDWTSWQSFKAKVLISHDHSVSFLHEKEKKGCIGKQMCLPLLSELLCLPLLLKTMQSQYFVFIFITQHTVSFSCWSRVATLASKLLFSWHDLSKYGFHLTHYFRLEVSFYIGIQAPYAMVWFELVSFPLN